MTLQAAPIVLFGLEPEQTLRKLRRQLRTNSDHFSGKARLPATLLCMRAFGANLVPALCRYRGFGRRPAC
jgi:hypothetical protein